MADKIDVGELSADRVGWTLLATLYLRAWESRNAHPILGDAFAASALDRLDFDEAMLRRRTRPEISQYLVGLRARLLDDWATAFLAKHGDAVVLQLGCGLDSRMLRLNPPAPAIWIDLDLPEVMAIRQRIYPGRDRYRMISASVSNGDWWEKVPIGRPILLIAEGLFMYLAESDVRRLMHQLTSRYAVGEVIFDGVSPWLTKLSPVVHWGLVDGHELEGWSPHLHCVEQCSLGARYELISNGLLRRAYQLGDHFPHWRQMLQAFRLEFGGKALGQREFAG